MTKDELIQRLKDAELPGDTVVYIANDDDRSYVECDEVVVTVVGALDSSRKIIAIY